MYFIMKISKLLHLKINLYVLNQPRI